MCGKIDCYLAAFSQLKAEEDKNFWPASTLHRPPHKPLLLLSMLDLVAQKKITKEFIEITDELETTFNSYWQKIMPPGSTGSMTEPFYHMQNEPFLTLVPRAGVDLPEAMPEYSRECIQQIYLGARLDKELFPLLLMEPLRRRLREALVQTYFAPEVQEILLKQNPTDTLTN